MLVRNAHIQRLHRRLAKADCNGRRYGHQRERSFPDRRAGVHSARVGRRDCEGQVIHVGFLVQYIHRDLHAGYVDIILIVTVVGEQLVPRADGLLQWKLIAH